MPETDETVTVSNEDWEEITKDMKIRVANYDIQDAENPPFASGSSDVAPDGSSRHKVGHAPRR